MKKGDGYGKPGSVLQNAQLDPEEIVENCRIQKLRVCVIYKKPNDSITPRLIDSMQCLSATVRRLYLTENKLTNLPAEIGTLTFLEELHLRGNQLTRLPPEIGRLKNLVRLDLKDNQLATIPASIRGMKNLNLLRLQNNNLRWLPPEIGSLGLLKKLNVRENNLEWLPLSMRKNATRVKIDEKQLIMMEELVNAEETHWQSYHNSYTHKEVIETLMDLCCNALLEMVYQSTVTTTSNIVDVVPKMQFFKKKKASSTLPFSLLDTLALPEVILPRFKGKIIRRRCERCRKTFVGGVQKFSSGKMGGTNVVFFAAYCTLACYRGRRRPPTAKVKLNSSHDGVSLGRPLSPSTEEKRKVLTRSGSYPSLRRLHESDPGGDKKAKKKKLKEKKKEKKGKTNKKKGKQKEGKENGFMMVRDCSIHTNIISKDNRVGSPGERMRRGSIDGGGPTKLDTLAGKLKDALVAVAKPKYKEL